MVAAVTLTPKGLAWLKTGHLWVYRDDVAHVAGSPANGEIVQVRSSAGTFLAQAFYSASSKIALRLVSRQPDPLDSAFFHKVFARTLAFRGGRLPRESAFRLLSAEGDFFPGLIVDVYAGDFVLQSMTAGTDRLLPQLAAVLEEMFSPSSLTLRSDLSSRALEGLEERKEMLRGEPPRSVLVKEGPVSYRADLWEGHKTGAYLDQQQNRLELERWVKPGGRALDAFCYQGHFSLHLARLCAEVRAVDSSGAALERLEENCRLNGFRHVQAKRANGFEELAELERRGERFEVIVLDPPAFARSRKDVPASRRAYRELNRRAMGLLSEEGILFTYSCSYNLSAAEFLAVLQKAAADARRQFRVLASQTQAPDHPVLLCHPETHYLKGFVLTVAE